MENGRRKRDRAKENKTDPNRKEDLKKAVWKKTDMKTFLLSDL